MTENIPPSASGTKPSTTSSAAANNTANASDRGLPYYESLRRSLRDTISRKRSMDRTLSVLEEQIHRAETSYLEETSSAGNIVKGFDNYIKAAATANTAASGTISGAQVGGTRRKAAVNDTDRVFSRSSVSWREATESGPASAVSTPGRATPVEKEKETVKERKNKKKNMSMAGTDDEGRAAGSNKRQKISFARKGHDD